MDYGEINARTSRASPRSRARMDCGTPFCQTNTAARSTT